MEYADYELRSPKRSSFSSSLRLSSRGAACTKTGGGGVSGWLSAIGGIIGAPIGGGGAGIPAIPGGGGIIAGGGVAAGNGMSLIHI